MKHARTRSGRRDTSTQGRRARRAAGTALVLAGALLPVVGVGTAHADPAPLVFSSAGEHPFTVPDGVTSMHVVAIGGAGGNGLTDVGVTAGGPGARVETEVPVTPGQQLFAEVGENGHAPVAFFGAFPGVGGANGGGAGSLHGGGGGGASDVRSAAECTDYTCHAASLHSRLVVAGGGGGGGGAAGEAGGAGGTPVGGDGTDGVGGATTDAFPNVNPIFFSHYGAGSGAGDHALWGAGGGGGLYGGGTGDSGGGGSSWSVVPALWTTATDGPSVTVTFAPATTTPAVPAAPAVQAQPADGAVVVTATGWDGGSPVTGYRTSVYSAAGAFLRSVDTGPRVPFSIPAANGSGVRLSVQALNAVGAGTASALTDVVVPVRPTAIPALRSQEFVAALGESSTEDFEVVNPGGTAVVLAGSTAAGDFSVDPSACTAAGILRAHQSCVLPVTFTPSRYDPSSGERTGSLVLSGTFPGGSASYGLYGQSVPARTPIALSITTTDLPAGSVGTPYSAALRTFGAQGTLRFSVDPATPLPRGLTLDPASGLLSGTPVTGFSGTVHVTATDTVAGTVAGTATASLPLTIPPCAPYLDPSSSFPDGAVGRPYDVQLLVDGGDGSPKTFTAGDGFPPGVVVDPVTGEVSGTPQQAVSGWAYVHVSDAAYAVTLRIPMDVAPADWGGDRTGTGTGTSPAPLTVVTTPALPQGTVGLPYSGMLAATGGTGALHWELAESVPWLPNGIALDASTGHLTGTPTDPYAAQIHVRVTDSGLPAATATAYVPLVMAPAPLQITTPLLPAGTVGAPYSVALTSTGGYGDVSWDTAGQALPAGLALDAAHGVLSGTPTAPFAGTVHLHAKGYAYGETTADLPLVIAAPAPLAVSADASAPAVVGEPFAGSLGCTGGVGAHRFVLPAGSALPDGLVLDAVTGVLSGAPTAAGPWTADVACVDSAQPTPHQAATYLGGQVLPAVAVPAQTLPTARVGVPYAAALGATGGLAPLHWGPAPGSTLPAGLVLADDGTIGGTPTAPAAAQQVGVLVHDAVAGAQPVAATLALTVVPAPAITSTGLPDATVGVPYSAQLTATGLLDGDTWAVDPAAPLPTGLALDPATGAVTGTPAVAGTTAVGVALHTREGAVTTASLPLHVLAPPLVVGTTALPDAQVGVPYAATLIASGGTGALRWSLAAGSALPAGLSLDGGAGRLSGTPTGPPGTSPVQLVVTDSASVPVTAPLVLPLTVTPAVGAPVLSSISPDSGSTSGLTRVQLRGSSLTRISKVTVDGRSVPFAVDPRSGVLTLLTPPHPAGGVPVVATGPAGLSNPLTFTYAAPQPVPPRIDGLTPATGPTTGGTWVRVTGAGLERPTAVTVDGVAVPALALPDGGSLFLLTPRHAAGPATLVVTTSAGRSNAAVFTYAAPLRPPGRGGPR